MKTKSSYSMGLAAILSCALTLPMETPAAPQSPARAGEVSRVIPAVSISRGGKTIPASAKSVVEWKDTINTLASARVRIGLDDGSVLNVGSDSSMQVIKHDSAAQQTELELTYGKLRTQAQKIAKPDGKFEVHTPAGVAGVVGTDFYVDYQNNVMNTIVFEGFVKVCNLTGQCVVLKPGQMTTIRSSDNSPPAVVQAPSSLLTSANTDTNVSGPNLGLAASNAAHISKFTILVVAVIAAIPAVVIPVVATHGNSTPAKPPACTTTDPSRPQPRCN